MLDEARAHVEAAHRALVAAAGRRTEADWLRVLPGRSAVAGGCRRVGARAAVRPPARSTRPSSSLTSPLSAGGTPLLSPSPSRPRL
jgi:hypothetical protein